VQTNEKEKKPGYNRAIPRSDSRQDYTTPRTHTTGHRLKLGFPSGGVNRREAAVGREKDGGDLSSGGYEQGRVPRSKGGGKRQ